jgi:MFS family permease
LSVRRPDALTRVVVVFVLHNLQMNMTRPYVPLFAASLDVGYLGVGIVAAAIGFLPLFFALPVGRLTDRVGVRPMVTAGAIINVSGFLLLSLVPSIVVIIITQLLSGFANLLVGLSAQTFVGTLGKGRSAERNFSIFTISGSIGQIGGPLIGGVLIGAAGFGAVFATSVVLSSACLVAALILLPTTTSVRAPGSLRSSPRRAVEYLKESDTRLAILASCLMSVPEVLRTAFLPIYLSEAVHLAPALLGYVLAIFSVAGLVAKSVLPRAVARFGRQVMLFAFTTACALALFALPLTISLAAVCVVIACMGLTFGLGRPLSMAMAANAATPGEEGFVVALRLSGNRIADLVLPVVFGSAAGVAGIGAAFVVGAGVLVLGAGALVGPMITEIRAAQNE